MEENPLQLSDEDLVLFKDKKYEKMSIFSQRHNLKQLGVYNYFETYDDEDVYYMNHCFGSEFFLDKNKKLLVHSNYQYEYFTGIGVYETINYIKRILELVKNIDNSAFQNAICIDKEVSAVGKWFDSYGHFSDEVFSLYDFNNELLLSEKKEATPVINYQAANATQNYELIGNYLFDGKLINTTDYGPKIIKFKRLRLVRNYFGQYAFHSFPNSSRDKVILKVKNNQRLLERNILCLFADEYDNLTFNDEFVETDNKEDKEENNYDYNEEEIEEEIEEYAEEYAEYNNYIDITDEDLLFNPVINDKIFITRGLAKSNPRNLDNQSEIEDHLDSMGYTVINPENITLDEFINYIYNASKIVMTWGSAMVNMCYLKNNTNVIILKSRSYEHESIELFQKIIDNNKLNVNVILHADNKITIPFI